MSNPQSKSLMLLECVLFFSLVSCGNPHGKHAAEETTDSVTTTEAEIWPEQIECESPEYPRAAKQEGVVGRVWIKAFVDANGHVTEAAVGKSSGDKRLDAAALEAAYKCVYKPGYQKGKPVPVWISYYVDFDLS